MVMVTVLVVLAVGLAEAEGRVRDMVVAKPPPEEMLVEKLVWTTGLGTVKVVRGPARTVMVV